MMKLVNEFHHLPAAVGSGQQHNELVAAEPADDVAFAQPLAEALADRPQDQVPAGMTEGVVDLLEAVEIDQKQGQTPAAASASAETLPQAFLEQQPVGQIGHPVVVGQVQHVPLGPRTLGDIASRSRLRSEETRGG